MLSHEAASRPRALVCRDVKRKFGDTVAVDGISLDLDRGSILSIIGPDGAGKTTLLRMLCGVLSPDSGGIDLLGIDMSRDPESGKARLGYMPQRFSLYADLTGRENLRFFADLYDVPPTLYGARARRLLDDFRLSDFVDIPSRGLSGGMKQKLALACTLVHEPELLVLDEPTAGVDPVSRRQFWRLLYGLNARGITIVLSTPYMDEAQHASHVALVHKGRLIAFDTPSRLKAMVAGRVIEIRSTTAGAVSRVLRGHPLVESLELFGETLHALVSNADTVLPALSSALAVAGVTGASMQPVEPSFEDAFVWLLEHDTPAEPR